VGGGPVQGQRHRGAAAPGGAPRGLGTGGGGGVGGGGVGGPLDGGPCFPFGAWGQPPGRRGLSVFVKNPGGGGSGGGGGGGQGGGGGRGGGLSLIFFPFGPRVPGSGPPGARRKKTNGGHRGGRAGGGLTGCWRGGAAAGKKLLGGPGPSGAWLPPPRQRGGKFGRAGGGEQTGPRGGGRFSAWAGAGSGGGAFGSACFPWPPPFHAFLVIQGWFFLAPHPAGGRGKNGGGGAGGQGGEGVVMEFLQKGGGPFRGISFNRRAGKTAQKWGSRDLGGTVCLGCRGPFRRCRFKTARGRGGTTLIPMLEWSGGGAHSWFSRGSGEK